MSIVAKRLDGSRCHLVWKYVDWAEAYLSQVHIVLDGDPALPKKGSTAPNFQPMSVVAKRLNGSRCHLVWRQASAQATLCYMGTQPVLPPPKKGGGAQPPNFRPMSIDTKWSPISATVEHLFIIFWFWTVERQTSLSAFLFLPFCCIFTCILCFYWQINHS